MEKQEDVSHVAIALSGGRDGLGEHGLVLGLRLQLDGVHVGHFGCVWWQCFGGWSGDGVDVVTAFKRRSGVRSMCCARYVGFEEQMLERKGEVMVLFHMYVRQQITAAVAVAGAYAIANRSAASSLLVGFVPWNRNALSHPLFLLSYDFSLSSHFACQLPHAYLLVFNTALLCPVHRESTTAFTGSDTRVH